MNEFGLKPDELVQILQVLKNNGIKRAAIFGSRAMGNYKKGSDVDLALYGDVSHERLTRISRGLNEETNLPYFFDVVLYNGIATSELIKHIDECGKNLILEEF